MNPVIITAVDDPRARTIEWATRTLTQGEVLDAFAAHCRDDLDDVELVEERPDVLAVDWRGGRERSRVELRADVLAGEGAGQVLALGPIDERVVARFLDDADLRGRLAVYDLVRLEKLNAVRSSVFVYFEWFLRDVYGVKVLAPNAFTRGLVERGIISLGFG
jgi:hypothetical protein